MVLLATALPFLVITGLLALVFSGGKNGTAASTFGVAGAVSGAAVAILAAVLVLVSGDSWEAWTLWQSPLGPMHAGMDRLSAIFVILISTVGALAAIYGRGYLAGHGQDTHTAGRTWCWFNILLASMLGVVCARDGLTFLAAWEVMSLASFFLVMYDHEKPGVTRAGWIYLVTTHVGTAFLFFMFMLMGDGGTLDFTSIAASGHLTSVPGIKTAVFIAALIGFGTKAGLVPTHIWLPEAHPAAPSHVSAVMSGVMIKTGIYGLLRVLMMLGPPPAWWGWTLIIVGAITCLFGVLFALAQHDLKRLLAYSTIENVGIIVMGIGVSLLGAAVGNSVVSLLGFAGALLHTVNHGVFKSLLFLGAGSVYHATGIRDIDRLGGLMKRMPVTGTTFVIGAAAISGLPPLNGFISEFMIFMGAFGLVTGGGAVWAGVVAILALAMTGGLAIAAFTKAAGVVFSGEPRSPGAAHAHESNTSMLVPMIVLAVGCVVLAFGAGRVLPLLIPVGNLSATAVDRVFGETGIASVLADVTLASALLAVLVLAIVAKRAWLLKGRESRTAPTWDCGYAAASPRVQYTGSSFADPILRMFRPVLRTERTLGRVEGDFPLSASLRTLTPDVLMSRIHEPAVRGVAWLAGQMQRLQQGSTHLYLMYIFLTIIILMVWNLR